MSGILTFVVGFLLAGLSSVFGLWIAERLFLEKKKVRPPSSLRYVELGIVCSVIFIVVALVLPNLIKEHIAANESLAITRLRTLNGVMELYRSRNGTYPRTPSDIEPLLRTTVDTQTAADLRKLLSGGAENGYIFAYVPTSDRSGNPVAFAVVATPANLGRSGSKLFELSNTGLIVEKRLNAQTSPRR